jgi:hypothetical protein
MGNLCSDSQTVTQRPKIFGKVTALLATFLGLFIILEIIIPLYRTFDRKELLSEIAFYFVFPIPAIVFGGYCLFVAYYAWTNLSVKIVRRISIIAAFVLVAIIISLFHLILKNPVWDSAAIPIFMIIGGIFYSLCSRLFIKWLGLKEVVDWSRREKSVRRFCEWTSIFVWLACTSIISKLLLKFPDRPDMPLLVPLIALFGPAIPIYLICKFAIWIILRNKPTEISK